MNSWVELRVIHIYSKSPRKFLELVAIFFLLLDNFFDAFGTTKQADVKDCGDVYTAEFELAGFAKEGFKNTRNFLSGVGKNIMGIKDNINEKITDTKEDVSEFIQDQRENVVGASKTITESIKEGGRGIFNISKNILSTAREKTLSTVAGAADFATGGRFDFDKKGSSDTDNVSPLGKIINAVAPPQTPQVDTSAIAPANKPNTSEVIIRPTSPTIPFIRTVKNQYLSTNPNTNKLPPEIARMIQ